MGNLVSGIYKIEDVVTGNVYVGSANQENGIKKRWSCHIANLRNGQHKYKELQEAFSVDPNRIKWEILEECKDDELEERENYWINYCNKIDGWTVINKQKKAKRGSKVKDKSKMVQAQTGENNGHCTKLYVNDVREIKQMLKDGVNKDIIAAKFDISVTHVGSIETGRRWKSVEI